MLIHKNPNNREYCVEMREHGITTGHVGYTDNFKLAQDQAERASQAYGKQMIISQWKPRPHDDIYSSPEIHGYWSTPRVYGNKQTIFDPPTLETNR